MNYTFEFHARASDPKTSHQAAASIDHFGLKPVEQTLIRILSNEICTDETLYEKYMDYVDMGLCKLYTPQAIRTIRVQMWRKNLLHVTGVGKNKAGRNARLWTACKCENGNHD
jgi:hypothetical protein